MDNNREVITRTNCVNIPIVFHCLENLNNLPNFTFKLPNLTETVSLQKSFFTNQNNAETSAANDRGSRTIFCMNKPVPFLLVITSANGIKCDFATIELVQDESEILSRVNNSEDILSTFSKKAFINVPLSVGNNSDGLLNINVENNFKHSITIVTTVLLLNQIFNEFTNSIWQYKLLLSRNKNEYLLLSDPVTSANSQTHTALASYRRETSAFMPIALSKPSPTRSSLCPISVNNTLRSTAHRDKALILPVNDTMKTLNSIVDTAVAKNASINIHLIGSNRPTATNLLQLHRNIGGGAPAHIFGDHFGGNSLSYSTPVMNQHSYQSSVAKRIKPVDSDISIKVTKAMPRALPKNSANKLQTLLLQQHRVHAPYLKRLSTETETRPSQGDSLNVMNQVNFPPLSSASASMLQKGEVPRPIFDFQFYNTPVIQLPSVKLNESRPVIPTITSIPSVQDNYKFLLPNDVQKQA